MTDQKKKIRKKKAAPKLPKIRRVVVATPSIDGKVDVTYTDSLINTIHLCAANGIQVLPLFRSYSSLLIRSRNNLVEDVVNAKTVESMVFIDADQAWKPEDFLKLVNSKKPVIAGAVPNKNDTEGYNVKLLKPCKKHLAKDEIVVDGVGTGFMKVSMQALRKIYNASKPYKDGAHSTRMVFESSVIKGELYSEDMTFCEKWKNLGGKIHLNTSITCAHIGTKMWAGDFDQFLNQVIINNESTKQ
ncbi:MAG: hypothetical protein KAS93_00230 [Gammaproteobacteria bacterium]|nr:hypothetical protein [Gammaproteobacteria bacterium]